MGYNHRYYKRHLDQYREWEIGLVQDLIERYQIKSMIDFGCAVGSFLEGAYLVGLKKLVGIEINYQISKQYTHESIVSLIKELDMTKPVELGTFDCGWSFEAAEHINPEGTDQFIDNLVNSSDRMIIMTAASAGQGGTGHINLKPKDFWIESISKHGFKYLEDDVKTISEFWANWKEYEIPDYLIKNLMIFEKTHE
jgi:hypothetical protein|tara:strand:+ start:1522 stop:2109 length:588 start_codon:yes stop_codon:yes gene_type:complete